MEIGYREDGNEKWHVGGDFASLDECQSAAVADYMRRIARSDVRTEGCK